MDLPSPANGLITYSSNASSPFSYLTEAEYSCHSGYGLSNGDVVRTCSNSSIQGDGEWNGTAPMCTGILCSYNLCNLLPKEYIFVLLVITCSPLSPLANGQIIYSVNDTLTYGVIATYLCEEGFKLVPSGANHIRTCGGNGSNPNGEWVGDAPTCKGKPSFRIQV